MMVVEHPFVLCNTPKGLRLIKIVESLEGIENLEYRWTREQLDADYEFKYQKDQFPYYELKNG